MLKKRRKMIKIQTGCVIFSPKIAKIEKIIEKSSKNEKMPKNSEKCKNDAKMRLRTPKARTSLWFWANLIEFSDSFMIFTNFQQFFYFSSFFDERQACNQGPQHWSTWSRTQKASKPPPLPPFGSPPPLSSRVFNLNTQIIIFGKKSWKNNVKNVPHCAR